MKLTPEQVAEILEQAKPDIIAGLKAEVIQNAQFDLSIAAGRLVRAEVERFIAAEVVPEVRARLVESKEGLVSLAVPLAEAITAMLAEKLAADAKKNLEQTWTRNDIVKKLFA